MSPALVEAAWFTFIFCSQLSCRFTRTRISFADRFFDRIDRFFDLVVVEPVRNQLSAVVAAPVGFWRIRSHVLNFVIVII